METRYATPYVGSITWVLNDPIVENVPVQDDSGQARIRQVTNDPGLTVEITPYLDKVAGKSKNYTFAKGAVDGTAVEDVLTAAGVDVATAWANALDGMANIFPILEDPESGDEAFGPPFYMRLDAWRAQLPWEGNKVVVATLGLYKDTEFTEVQAYVQLVFADGNTIRQIDNQKTRIQERIDRANSILADTPTFEGWDDLPVEEQERLTNEANQELPNLTNELARLNSQLVAPLSDLLSMASIQTSIGALLGGVFATLKATDPEYANTDPTSIMSKFALPDVS